MKARLIVFFRKDNEILFITECFLIQRYYRSINKPSLKRLYYRIIIVKLTFICRFQTSCTEAAAMGTIFRAPARYRCRTPHSLARKRLTAVKGRKHSLSPHHRHAAPWDFRTIDRTLMRRYQKRSSATSFRSVTLRALPQDRRSVCRATRKRRRFPQARERTGNISPFSKKSTAFFRTKRVVFTSAQRVLSMFSS